MGSKLTYSNVIQQVVTRAGFSLAEVERIRKELAEVQEGSDEHAYLWTKAYSAEHEACLLGRVFLWDETSQGLAYWRDIHQKIAAYRKKRYGGTEGWTAVL